MKTILIPFFDDAAAESALSCAVMIAKRFNSHIEGMFVAPRTHIVDGGIGIATAYTYATQMEKDSLILAERARSRFESALTKHNIKMSPMNGDAGTVTADWRDFANTGTSLVGDDGRVFDLIVVGRGFGHEWTDWNTICESALFESGRPVLITPQQTSKIGDHAAIAWNGSTETARTIALSMPVLLQTKNVTVITMNAWSVPGPEGDELVNYLTRNGINASLVNRNLGDRTPGRAVVEEAIDAGADLLLKGAYTQSRLRQLVFGGATRQILNEANLPVLMAH